MQDLNCAKLGALTTERASFSYYRESCTLQYPVPLPYWARSLTPRDLDERKAVTDQRSGSLDCTLGALSIRSDSKSHSSCSRKASDAFTTMSPKEFKICSILTQVKHARIRQAHNATLASTAMLRRL